MRLICGLMCLDGAAAELSLLHRMASQMDAPPLRTVRSEFCEGAVALAALDFSASSPGPLPTVGSTVMAADARLDEPAELARSLSLDSLDQDALLLAVVDRL